MYRPRGLAATEHIGKKWKCGLGCSRAGHAWWAFSVVLSTEAFALASGRLALSGRPHFSGLKTVFCVLNPAPHGQPSELAHFRSRLSALADMDIVQGRADRPRST